MAFEKQLLDRFDGIDRERFGKELATLGMNAAVIVVVAYLIAVVCTMGS